MQTVEKKPTILTAIQFAEMQALDIPEDATPEEIEAIEAAWEKAMDEAMGDLQEGLTRIRLAIERETFLSEQHDPEINLLKRELELRMAGKMRHVNHAARLKKYAAKCLEFAGGPVEAEGFQFRLQKNGGAPKVEILDRDQIPTEYQVPQPWQPDTKAIAHDAEKLGKEIPGVKVERGVHLRIKAV